MYPEQPQPQPPQPQPPLGGSVPPQPGQPGGTYPAPQAQPQFTPAAGGNYTPPQSPYMAGQPGGYPAQPSGATPQTQPGQPTYAVDYLEQIAPPPPKQAFLSGGFGKIIVLLAVIFFFAVGLIVALGNQKKTADLELISTRLENYRLMTKDVHVNLKNSNLRATNSNFQNWLGSASHDADELLAQAEVKKSRVDKKIVASEKASITKLKDKFNDAKLNAKLDDVYAAEMAYQSKIMITLFNTMSKKSQAKAIRDYAKNAASQLTPIQKSFADYKDDLIIGN